MFPLSPTLWMAVGAALLIAGLGIVVKVQTSRLEAVTAEYTTFKADVKAMGELAQKVADAQKAVDKSKKEKADANNAKTVAALADTIKRLRDERTSSSLLPPASPDSRNPEVVSFDRTQLDGALSGFVEGAANLIVEGSKAVVDLNTAKQWAN